MDLNMSRLLCLALLFVSCTANAIVIRDDVADAEYQVAPSEFPALVDLPGAGHGVLIAPEWVVTAAHAVSWQSAITEVSLGGVDRPVERVVIHPGFRQPSQALQEQALATWDWTLFRALLASSDDIALVQLKEAVTDVAPVALYTRDDEFGQTVTVFGKGASGHGATGYAFSDPQRTELRRAHNQVTSAHERWLCYVFDAPPQALPLEGGTGSGDSGGPVLIRAGEDWLLAGLGSWVDPQSTVRKPGRYGQVSCNVRLSHYGSWIESVISAKP
jgi:secreted trypsin-like serine protease